MSSDNGNQESHQALGKPDKRSLSLDQCGKAGLLDTDPSGSHGLCAGVLLRVLFLPPAGSCMILISVWHIQLFHDGFIELGFFCHTIHPFTNGQRSSFQYVPRTVVCGLFQNMFITPKRNSAPFRGHPPSLPSILRPQHPLIYFPSLKMCPFWILPIN